MNNDISVHEPSERVKALRDAAGAVCPLCAQGWIVGKKIDYDGTFVYIHPGVGDTGMWATCDAGGVQELVEQAVAAALTKTFILESDNAGQFMALQMLAEEARIIYEILAQDGLPRGKYPTFLATIEKAEEYTIKRWKRDDPGFAERHVAEGMERVKGEARG